MHAARLIDALPEVLRPKAYAAAEIARVPGVSVVTTSAPHAVIVCLISSALDADATNEPADASSAAMSTLLPGCSSAVARYAESDSTTASWRPATSAGGYVFKSSPATYDECLSRMLFGAPGSGGRAVLALQPWMSVLFLYDSAAQVVRGAFTPAAPPGLLLDPDAWSLPDGGPSPYPAQVCSMRSPKPRPCHDAFLPSQVRVPGSASLQCPYHGDSFKTL